MTIHSALYRLLTSNGAVAALVGDRVYPMQAPQDTAYPLIVFSTIVELRAPTLAGASGAVNPKIQVDCWAESNEDADSLSDAVRLALDGYRGTVGSVVIRACALGLRHDGIVEPRDGTENRVFGRNMEFDVWHTETVPTF